MTTVWPPGNLLCYGDNLAFLKHFDDQCVDLVYLDPPFNSQQNYNVLFKEASGTPEAAQIKAFEDTWTWDMAANIALNEINTDPAVPPPLVELMSTFLNFLKPSPMMAYLVQMAIRLVHLRRVLKPTGSLYLHCDPTASHYLKIVLDGIFGPTCFRNEITWKRTHSHGNVGRNYGSVTDTILFLTKEQRYTWNQLYCKFSDEYIAKTFKYSDPGGRRWQSVTLRNPGKRPNLHFPYKASNGITYQPHPNGWSCDLERLSRYDREGRLHFPRKSSGALRLKMYLDESLGVRLQNLWDDIAVIGSQAAERMGYPTQKPLELLKRIVAASSNPGDVVLDPFCGCGTTIDAVETLNREQPDQPPRKWIGIDITHLSINLIKHRLMRFSPPSEYDVWGEPESVSGARVLAEHERFQFQCWALGLVGARPAGGTPKKGADRGIDGVRFFQDEQKKGVWMAKKMLVQVKSGKVKSPDIRDFVGTMSREQAELGVFITLEKSTKPMRTEAASAGTYLSPYDNQPYPRVQILTIEQLLKDPHRPNPSCLQIPGGAGGPNITLPQAPKHRRKTARQRTIDFDTATGKDDSNA